MRIDAEVGTQSITPLFTAGSYRVFEMRDEDVPRLQQFFEPCLTGIGGDPLNGTDLGVPVEHGGKLYFFFGDAAPYNDIVDDDPIAWMTTADPDDLEFWPDVHWIVNSAGRFQPLTVEGQTLGNFEVPTGAFSWDGHLYVFIARAKLEEPTARMTTSTLVVRDAAQ